MGNVLLEQVYLFLIYCISGMLIGVLFDIFRILRRSFKTIDLVTYIEDILFWILTGSYILFILFKFSNGEIRLYSIVGLVIGCISYILTISKLFIKINVKIVTLIKTIVYKVANILAYPIKLIFKVIRKIFTPFTFFVINFKKILFSPKIKLKNRRKFACKRRNFKINVEK